MRLRLTRGACKQNVRFTALLLFAWTLNAQDSSRDDVLKAMRKAADFYRNK
jgi:hypothetical protein